MKTIKIIIIFIITLLLGIYLFIENKYVKFYPIEFNNEKYVVIEKNIISHEFYLNLKKVLSYYDEDFKEKNGVIYIKNELSKDKELLYNYTKKASDSLWILNR